MRVLILEPHLTGHHASYLRWLVQAADKKKWSVVIATTADALPHPALSAITVEFSNVVVHPMQVSPEFLRTVGRSSQLIRRELGYWRMFKRTVQDLRARSAFDLVIVPYVDYCFYALAILGAPFGEIPWCGISMRLSVQNPQAESAMLLPWKWRMAKRLLATRNLKTLFVINPSVSDVPANWYTAGQSSKLRYLPDPAEYKVVSSRSESRAALGVSLEQVAILVFGSIDERKGIDSLIAAIVSQNDLANYVVILAGQHSANMRSEILTRPAFAQLLAQNRLFVLDRFVSDTELGSLLAASDLVWVGYRNHIYMSGVLVLAGMAGLPVVGTMEGEIGRLITKHAMGVCARIDHPAEVADALRAMLDDARRREMGRRGRAAFEHHTVDGFGASVLAAFEV